MKKDTKLEIEKLKKEMTITKTKQN